jgi:hypothetical protein
MVNNKIILIKNKKHNYMMSHFNDIINNIENNTTVYQIIADINIIKRKYG